MRVSVFDGSIRLALGTVHGNIGDFFTLSVYHYYSGVPIVNKCIEMGRITTANTPLLRDIREAAAASDIGEQPTDSAQVTLGGR